MQRCDYSWAKVSAVCEVFGEFSQLIPQKGLAKLERGRERECLVPDFKV